MQRTIVITSGTQSQKPIDAAPWQHKVILYVYNRTTPSAIFPFIKTHASYLKPNTVLATVVSATWDTAGWAYELDIPDAICATPADLDTSWLDYCQVEEASPSALAKATDNETSKTIDTSTELAFNGTYPLPRLLKFPADLSEDGFEVDGTSKKLKPIFTQIGTGAPVVGGETPTPIDPPFYIDDTEGSLALYWYDPDAVGWRALIVGEGANVFSFGTGDIGDPGVSPEISPPIYFATGSGTLYLYYSGSWNKFEHPSQCPIVTTAPTGTPAAGDVFKYDRVNGVLWINNKATPTASWVRITFDPTSQIIVRDDDAAAGTPSGTPLHFDWTTGIFKVYADGTWKEPKVRLDNLNLTGGVKAYAYGGFVTKTSGTAAEYTWPADARMLFVEVWGGGGGSAGVDGTASSGEASIGGAGGGGGYAAAFFTNSEQTFAYTVGAGGSAGASGLNDGGDGGTTSFVGSVSGTLQATGGGKGVAQAGGTGVGTVAGGAGGVGSGVTLTPALVLTGGQGGTSTRGDGKVFMSGSGGQSPIIGTPTPHTGAISGSAADAATTYGCGASGSSVRDSTTNYAGAAGAAGLIKISIYY